MKKEYYLRMRSFLEVLVIAAVILLVTTLLQAKQVQDDKENTSAVKELVDVVNVEMVMRAMRQGAPLSGLKPSDFTVLENGKPVEVTSFTEVHRQIGSRDMVELETADKNDEEQTRFFLLYFWISDHSIDYKSPLDYFFREVYRQGDIVFMVAQDKAYRISSPDDIAPARKKLDAQLSAIASQIQGTYTNAVNAMTDAFDDFIEAVSRREPDPNLLNKLKGKIIQAFSNFFNSYQRQYLTTNFKQLIGLAESLKDIPVEKWGIVFFQQSTVPYFDVFKATGRLQVASDISPDGLVAILQNIERRIQRPLASVGHMVKIQQAFIRANTTFNMIIPSGSIKDKGYSDLMKLSSTYSEWQDSFSKIAKFTGGEILHENMMKTALQKLVAREDIYYRLTYKPRNLEKTKRKIKIKSKLEGVEVFHPSTVDVHPLQNIRLTDVNYKDDRLSLTVKDYHRIAIGDKEIGDVQLVVTAADDYGEIVEFMKHLELKGEDASISMKTKFPQQGNLTVLITAWDNLSGLKTQYTLKVKN